MSNKMINAFIKKTSLAALLGALVMSMFFPREEVSASHEIGLLNGVTWTSLDGTVTTTAPSDGDHTTVEYLLTERHSTDWDDIFVYNFGAPNTITSIYADIASVDVENDGAKGSLKIMLLDSAGAVIHTEQFPTTGVKTVTLPTAISNAYSVRIQSGVDYEPINLAEVELNVTTDISAPEEVTFLRSVPEVNQVKLNFTLPSQSDFSHTKVYYSSDDGATFTLFNEVNNTDSTATVTGLEFGPAYKFKVTTVDTNGNESTGVAINAKTLDIYAPAEVANVTASTGANQVALNYTLPADSDLSYTNVYYSSDGGVTYTLFPRLKEFSDLNPDLLNYTWGTAIISENPPQIERSGFHLYE